MRAVPISLFRYNSKVISGGFYHVQTQQQTSCISYMALSRCNNRPQQSNFQHNVNNKNAIHPWYKSVTYNQSKVQFSSQGNVRYFPNYVLHKDEGAFSLKFVPPMFKRSKQNINVGRKGKLIFEVAPRLEGETMTHWSGAINIALSVEELGELLCNMAQLKESTFRHTSMHGESKQISIMPHDSYGSYKILISVDDDDNQSAEEKVILTEGEMEVVRNLISVTMPNMTAFNTLVENSINSLVNKENVPSSSTSLGGFNRNDYDM